TPVGGSPSRGARGQAEVGPITNVLAALVRRRRRYKGRKKATRRKNRSAESGPICGADDRFPPRQVVKEPAMVNCLAENDIAESLRRMPVPRFGHRHLCPARPTSCHRA